MESDLSDLEDFDELASARDVRETSVKVSQQDQSPADSTPSAIYTQIPFAIESVILHTQAQNS